MKKIILALLIGLAASAHALEFKGIELAKKLDEEKVLGSFDELGKSCEPDGEEITCWGNTSIGGEFGSVRLYADSEKLIYLIIVSFESTGYESVNRALITKFGSNPKVTQSRVGNRMGATATNVVKEWNLKQCSVEFQKYFGKLDRSAVIYQCSTPARQKALRNQRQKADKDI